MRREYDNHQNSKEIGNKNETENVGWINKQINY